MRREWAYEAVGTRLTVICLETLQKKSNFLDTENLLALEGKSVEI